MDSLVVLIPIIESSFWYFELGIVVLPSFFLFATSGFNSNDLKKKLKKKKKNLQWLLLLLLEHFLFETPLICIADQKSWTCISCMCVDPIYSNKIDKLISITPHSCCLITVHHPHTTLCINVLLLSSPYQIVEGVEWWGHGSLAFKKKSLLYTLIEVMISIVFLCV